MKIETIDAKLLQTMIVAGASLLEERKEFINELNVFPVPDGDTGTNMALTMLAAAKEVQNIDPTSVADIGKAASMGSLRGARGNSGVILSQLIRGFAKGLTEDTIDTLILANAFQSGVDMAYKAVMKPKEGTILTVARKVAQKAIQLSLKITDLEQFAKEIIEYGYEVLNRTPDMLPVLKEAGVVDAGGQGLMTILEGAAKVITGEIEIVMPKPIEMNKEAYSALKNFNTEDITFGYCTEFIVTKPNKDAFDETPTQEFLATIGDSLVVVADEEFVKIHVHTDDPGLALQHGLQFGSLSNIKIENMREQHTSIFEEEKPAIVNKGPRKKVAFVSVVAGSGLVEIMESLGVDEVIEGGQTMNPSIEDIGTAITNAHAENVIVLPNNSNIILAAEQASQLAQDCTVHVLPTKTVPQGVSAIISYDGHAENVEDTLDAMNEAISNVETAQITIAVRDTTMNGKDIIEGEYLGILESDIVAHHKDLKTTFNQLLRQMNQDAEIVTIYYGQDIDDDTAQEYLEETQKIFEDADIELHFGNQPVYYFMISAE
ncbi:MAG: dihydroxyacetone kinase [Epulopiscium sp. Nele67-Bin005]|nr:MAG: dihydroxyacetone kinase [Epulopiscium sp. Nele67-Bin005]